MLKTGTAMALDKMTGDVVLSKFSTKLDSDWVWSTPLNKSLYFQPYLTKNGWEVEVVKYTDSDSIDASIIDDTLSFRNNCVVGFDVEVRRGNSVETYSLFERDRISRTMLDRNKVVRLISGYCDAYLIGLVGATCSGKSCLRYSVLSPAVHAELKNLLSCDTVTTQYGSTKVDRFEASKISTFAPQAVGFQKGRSEVEIQLVDLAGEITCSKFNAGSEDIDIAIEERRAIEAVSRAAKHFDNLYYVTKGESLIQSSEENRFTVDTPNVIALNRLAPSVAKKAICVVTQARQIQAAAGARTADGKPLFTNYAIIGANSPVFDRVTNAEDLRAHSAIANSFLSDCIGQHLEMPTFIVDSCRETDENTLEFSDPLNVAALLADTLTKFTRSFKVKE